MAANSLYYVRKAQGLCVTCGDSAQDGKTQCAMCAKLQRIKQKAYRDALPDEAKQRQYQRVRRWLAEHPDRVEEYKRLKPEYNRRQMERIYG